MYEILKELSLLNLLKERLGNNLISKTYLKGENIFDNKRLLNLEDRRLIKFSGWKWFRNKIKLNFRYMFKPSWIIS